MTQKTSAQEANPQAAPEAQALPREEALKNLTDIAEMFKLATETKIGALQGATPDQNLTNDQNIANQLSGMVGLVQNSPDGKIAVSVQVLGTSGQPELIQTDDYISVSRLHGYLQAEIDTLSQSQDPADQAKLAELQKKQEILTKYTQTRKQTGVEINDQRAAFWAQMHIGRPKPDGSTITQDEAIREVRSQLENEQVFVIPPAEVEIIPQNQPLTEDQLQGVAMLKERLALVSNGVIENPGDVLRSIISLESNFARLDIVRPEYIEMKKVILENFEELFAEKPEDDPKKSQNNRIFVNDAKVAIAKWERGKFQDALQGLESRLEEYKGYPDKVTEINKQIEGYKARVAQAEVVIASDIREIDQDIKDKPNNFAYLAAQAIQALDPKTFGELQRFEGLLADIHKNPLGALEVSMEGVLADGAKRTRLFGFARGEAVNEFIASLPDGNPLKANPDKLTELIRVMAGDESRSERAKRFGMIGVMALLAIMFFGLQSGMSSMNQESH